MNKIDSNEMYAYNYMSPSMSYLDSSLNSSLFYSFENNDTMGESSSSSSSSISGLGDEASTKFEHYFSFTRDNLTYEPWLSVLILIVASLMSLTTIIGNVFVISAFIIEKGLRKYSNYFILNLSIADLLIGILIPPYAPFLLFKRQWRIGKIACTVWLVLDYVVGSASVLCIVVISLDRYLLVSRGLDYVANQKIFKAFLIMLTVWVIAFLNYAPAIIFWELISGQETVKDGECQVAFYDNLYYLTATACVEFFAPLISICGLNLAVYLNIRKRSRGLIRSENPQFNLPTSPPPATPANTINVNNLIAKKASNNNNNIDTTKRKGSKKVARPVVDKVFDDEEERNTLKLDELDIDISPDQKLTNPDVANPNVKHRTITFSVSRSSTTGSSLSLEDIQSTMNAKKKVTNNASKKIPVNSALNNGRSGKATTTTGSILVNANAGGALTKNSKNFLTNQSNDSNISKTTPLLQTQMSNSSSAKATKSSTLGSGHSKFNKSNSTSRTLTKDKKAARSLFILVFVFGFCWVCCLSQIFRLLTKTSLFRLFPIHITVFFLD